MDSLLKSDIKFFPGFHLQRSAAELHLMKHYIPVYPCVVKKQFWKIGQKFFTFYAMDTVLQKAFVKWKCKIMMYGIVYALNCTKYIPKEMFEKDPLKEYCVSSDKNQVSQTQKLHCFF